VSLAPSHGFSASFFTAFYFKLSVFVPTLLFMAGVTSCLVMSCSPAKDFIPSTLPTILAKSGTVKARMKTFMIPDASAADKEQGNGFNAQVFSTTAALMRYSLINDLNEAERHSTLGGLLENLVDDTAAFTHAQRPCIFFQGLFKTSFSKIFNLYSQPGRLNHRSFNIVEGLVSVPVRIYFLLKYFSNSTII